MVLIVGALVGTPTLIDRFLCLSADLTLNGAQITGFSGRSEGGSIFDMSIQFGSISGASELKSKPESGRSSSWYNEMMQMKLYFS